MDEEPLPTNNSFTLGNLSQRKQMLLEVNDRPNWLKSKTQIKYKADSWIKGIVLHNHCGAIQRGGLVYLKNQAKLNSFDY